MADGKTGVTYVVNTSYWTQGEVSAEKLYNLRRNVYGASQARKQRHLVMPQPPKIEVLGPDNNADEALQTTITRMMEAPAVDYANRIVQAEDDVFWWGLGIFNPVWQMVGNTFTLTQLRRLPPQTFDQLPPNARYTWCDILCGIVIGKDEQGNERIEFWQHKNDGQAPKQLDTNLLFWVKDPASTELAGESVIRPVVPIIEMLAFGWSAEMQRINRIGSPPLFMKVTGARPANPDTGEMSDLEYADLVLKNWGKDNLFSLRENMEPIFYTGTESGLNTEIIAGLQQLVDAYFSPSGAISKDGTLIGGSAQPELQLLESYVNGIRRWLEVAFSRLVQRYLDENKYVGYTGKVILQGTSQTTGQLELDQATLGAQTKVLDPNEVRERLGAEGVDDASLKKIAEKWALLGQGTPAPADAALAELEGGVDPVGFPGQTGDEEAEAVDEAPVLQGPVADDIPAPMARAREDLESGAYETLWTAVNRLAEQAAADAGLV